MKSLKLVFSREYPNHLLIQVKSRHGNFKLTFKKDKYGCITNLDIEDYYYNT